jgi:hypothetical protein
MSVVLDDFRRRQKLKRLQRESRAPGEPWRAPTLWERRKAALRVSTTGKLLRRPAK